MARLIIQLIARGVGDRCCRHRKYYHQQPERIRVIISKEFTHMSEGTRCGNVGRKPMQTGSTRNNNNCESTSEGKKPER